MLKIEFLNHASIQIEVDDFKLLCDPWFFGTCFQEGWGLKKYNDKAIHIAKTATHLWISHFHSDHFHIPTLKKVLEVNPNIIVLGNDSYNFKLNEAMKGLGFKNVISIYERKKIDINSNVKITRYPTTGIDNMLLINTLYGNILNYNDCNLPPLSRKIIKKKLGSIDIITTNFNHAGKLLNYPISPSDVIKNKLKESFKNNYESFSVKYIFPFASHHYYRAPESKYQNLSLLTTEELLNLDDRILNINIGDTLTYKKNVHISIQKGNVIENDVTFLERTNHKSFEDLKYASINYSKILMKNYGFLCRFLPKFYIEITDLNQIVNLNPKKGFQKIDTKSSINPVIKANSDVIYNWFTTIYGTDSFVVGAHFEISDKNKIPLKWQIVFGLLIDNKLSVNNIIKMFFSLSGIKFLINRREEILGILLQRKIHADYHD